MRKLILPIALAVAVGCEKDPLEDFDKEFPLDLGPVGKEIVVDSLDVTITGTTTITIPDLDLPDLTGVASETTDVVSDTLTDVVSNTITDTVTQTNDNSNDSDNSDTPANNDTQVDNTPAAPSGGNATPVAPTPTPVPDTPAVPDTPQQPDSNQSSETLDTPDDNPSDTDTNDDDGDTDNNSDDVFDPASDCTYTQSTESTTESFDQYGDWSEWVEADADPSQEFTTRSRTREVTNYTVNTTVTIQTANDSRCPLYYEANGVRYDRITNQETINNGTTIETREEQIANPVYQPQSQSGVASDTNDVSNDSYSQNTDIDDTDYDPSADAGSDDNGDTDQSGEQQDAPIDDTLSPSGHKPGIDQYKIYQNTGSNALTFHFAFNSEEEYNAFVSKGYTWLSIGAGTEISISSIIGAQSNTQFFAKVNTTETFGVFIAINSYIQFGN